jgi:thiol-disulfide isomerase/thioredoxin
MKRISLLLTVLICTIFSQAQTKPKPQTKTAAPVATDAYNIKATITPYKNSWMYLGSYYGKNKVLVDSAWCNNNSICTFKGKEKLVTGVYFIVSQQKAILFELMVDAKQHFSLTADSAHFDKVTFENSPDNTLFADYTTFLSTVAPKMNSLQGALKVAYSQQDSVRILGEMKNYNDQMNQYRDNVITQHPQSILAGLLKLMKGPEVPKPLKLANGKVDSTYPYHYVKEHYWDGVDFSDDRLLRTPVFDPKLEEYYKYYVSPEPDSIIQEVNYMLLASREGKDMHKYLLGRFTDKYINPEIMGQDKVFLFLFENYFAKGDTTWLTPTQRKFIFDRAYSLMANQINQQAPALDLLDTANKPTSLFNIKAPLTFVAFWDPNCSHCKVEIPRIDSFYEAKWKALGVKVYAVNVNDAAVPEWKQFIADQKLNGWYHAYQPKEQREADNAAGRANFRQLYDIYQTPTFYLLDVNKNIIAKKLSIEQFDALIEAKLKAQSSR